MLSFTCTVTLDQRILSASCVAQLGMCPCLIVLSNARIAPDLRIFRSVFCSQSGVAPYVRSSSYFHALHARMVLNLHRLILVAFALQGCVVCAYSSSVLCGGASGAKSCWCKRLWDVKGLWCKELLMV